VIEIISLSDRPGALVRKQTATNGAGRGNSGGSTRPAGNTVCCAWPRRAISSSGLPKRKVGCAVPPWQVSGCGRNGSGLGGWISLFFRSYSGNAGSGEGVSRHRHGDYCGGTGTRGPGGTPADEETLAALRWKLGPERFSQLLRQWLERTNDSGA